MISFLMTGLRFIVKLIRGLSDHEFRNLFAALIVLISSGMFFYHAVEGWPLVDSLYFCVMTLATVGYGDLSPSTDLSKLFTVIYVFVGLGVFAGFISKMSAQHSRKRGASARQTSKSD